jgi:flavin-dependent dehydrogenase
MKGPIVIVGGGTAGWLGALFFKKKNPNEKVILVESKEIGVVGVGEGSTPYLLDLFKILDISILDILKSADIAFKNGTYFSGWDDIYVNFFHPFNIIDDNYYNSNVELISHLLKNNASDLFRNINPLYDITDAKKISKIINGLPANDYSIHFDSFSMGRTLKNIALSRGVEWIEGIVEDVILEDNKVHTLILKNNNRVTGSFFVDCSGFHRFLPNKLGVKFNIFDELLVDSAFPCPIEGIYFDPYTQCKAMKHGWKWVIPTRQRVGTGYVFSSKYTTEEQARNEFIEHTRATTGQKIDPQKIIKFQSGMLEKLYFNNVLALGLSSHFLEPLEATSILITSLTLLEFDKMHSRETFNLSMSKRIIQIKDFILLHYYTKKTNTQFWIDASKNASKNEFIMNLITDIKENKQISYDVFKENDNYFGFTNHYLFLQKYGHIRGTLSLKEYDAKDVSIDFLKHFYAWHKGCKETAVDYRDYYIKLL